VKKKIGIFLSVTLLMMSIIVSAAENRLTVNGTENGGTHIFDVQIETEIPLCVGSFEIEYDSGKFLLENLKLSDVLSGAITETNEKYQQDSAKVSFMSMEPRVLTGKLVSFEVSPKIEGASGEIRLKNLLFADAEEEIVEFEGAVFKIGKKNSSGSVSRPSSKNSKPIVWVSDDVLDDNPEKTDSEVELHTETKSEIEEKITFSDLGMVPWAETQILSLAQMGIINGTGNGEFLPDSNIKRGDFVCMLMRMMGKSGGKAEEFFDVKNDEYWYDAIMTARSLEIATGFENNFQPQQPITRQDMFVLVCRAFGFESQNDALGYKDADKVAEYAKKSIVALTEKGMIQGSDGFVQPLDNATRAETAVMLYNISTNSTKEEKQND